MEKILERSVVNQGLIIIAYYFSNRWYRKCLFSESQTPALNNTDSVKIAQPERVKKNSQLGAQAESEQTAANNKIGKRLRQFNEE